jgi:hypothetical protein
MNGQYDFTNYKNDATLLTDTVRSKLGPRVQGFIDIDEEYCSACGSYTDGDIVVIVECVAQGISGEMRLPIGSGFLWPNTIRQTVPTFTITPTG